MKKYLKKLFVLLILISIFTSESSAETHYQGSEKYKGVIVNIVGEEDTQSDNFYQEAEVELEDGQVIKIINSPQIGPKIVVYDVGDKVVVQKFSIGQDLADTYVIVDFQRTGYIKILFLIFLVTAVLIGRIQGLYSLLGMFFSFLIIFKFILPQIINGNSPILVTIAASAILVPLTFYLSHGINNKTHVAIASTVITLIVTTLLSSISVNLAKLTGYSSEEAMFLQIADQSINMKGILLSGIIIGFLGVLDDVTVSQASIVTQLRKSKRYNNNGELYKDAMTVGRDHITSMINTLVLVYSGASMPLLLLFINSPQPFMDVINLEMVADEIVRTLVGSIGLVLAVPLTTLMAVRITDE